LDGRIDSKVRVSDLSSKHNTHTSPVTHPTFFNLRLYYGGLNLDVRSPAPKPVRIYRTRFPRLTVPDNDSYTYGDKTITLYVCVRVCMWCHKKATTKKWHDFFHDEVIYLYGLYAESIVLLFCGSESEGKMKYTTEQQEG
jgi:hypothetical protein